MSTFVSLTSSSYDPYAEGLPGMLSSEMNCSARDLEDDEATAVMVWLTSRAPRALGSLRRSATNAACVLALRSSVEFTCRCPDTYSLQYRQWLKR